MINIKIVFDFCFDLLMYKLYIFFYLDVDKIDLCCVWEGSESLDLLLNKMIVVCFELMDCLFLCVFG